MNSIEELSILGLGGRLQKAFGLDNAPLEVSTNDRIHMANNLARRNKDQAVSFPILAYSVSTIGESDHASAVPSLLMGAAAQRHADTQGVITYVPCNISFEVTYIDNDRTRLLRFAHCWMRAAYSGTLNFRLRVDGAPIDIQVRPEPNLSIPAKELTADAVNQYELTGVITMRTYMSGPFEHSIKQLTRIREIVGSFMAVGPDQVPEDTSGKSLSQLEASAEDYEQDRSKSLAFVIVTKLD